MATKQQLIDTFYQHLRRVAPHLKPHRLLVEQNMARAWNQILHDAFRKDLTFLDFYAKDYLSQDVLLNATTHQYYTTLPEAIVQLPDKSEGVRGVEPGDQNFSTPSGTGVKFVPMSDSAMRMKDNIDVTLAESTVIGYAVRYDKILYDRHMMAAQAAKAVHLKLVIPFDAYTSAEEIPVPSGKDEDLYRLTASFILGAQEPKTQ